MTPLRDHPLCKILARSGTPCKVFCNRYPPEHMI
jgi:hypothetical protein